MSGGVTAEETGGESRPIRERIRESILLDGDRLAVTGLALLVAFVLRTATVTQRTAATLPFTTPEQ
ncbi:hypothetical protein [Halorussus amylolyticus]|uniref:hypothetical protein n=1 Tax=Halorussus amylolyticus TaxID=1126242 RepID=UPI00104E15D1|nr:hypothetical protein [Halorussus amylolyticus]